MKEAPMPAKKTPLRVNLQRIYRWSFPHDYCQLCKGSIGYGALVETYTPPPAERNPSQTEAEAFQAADDYCNALADRQEEGQFTMYAMYPVCGECASRLIIEDISDFAAPLLSIIREQQESLWMAVCLQYEPGAYGKYQPFFIHSYLPLPLEQIYSQARKGYLSDEPRLELAPYPLDEGHHKAGKRQQRPRSHHLPSSLKKRRRKPGSEN